MMPRRGVLGEATRIDPAPADHEALGDLAGRDPEAGELVLRTADGTEISLPASLLRLVVTAANNLAKLLPESRHRRIKLEDVLAFQGRRERRSEGRRRIADIAATADLPYL
jgi:hypothetical protein